MKIPSHVLCEQVNDETVLLDMQSGHYFGLPGVASLFWKQLEQGESYEEARDTLLARFDVDRETLDRDLQTLMQDLRAKGLIEDAA